MLSHVVIEAVKLTAPLCMFKLVVMFLPIYLELEGPHVAHGLPMLVADHAGQQ